MSSHLKFCSCAMCRRGRYTSWAKATTKKAVRGARRRWNKLTTEGRDEEIAPISIPYTD